MRAVIFDEYGDAGVLKLAEVAVPAPRAGEVRIRIQAAAVNPADYKWRQGMFKDMIPLSFPHILGYDIAGVIDQVGEGVAGWRAGDRVAAMLDPITKGGYAEFATVAANSVAKVPDSLDIDVAAAVPTAGLTGVQLIEEHIQPGQGQRVLITGALGAVGRFAVHAALGLGARVIAGVRGDQQRLALELGAHEVAVLGDDWCGGSFDHVADTLGGPEVTALCRHLAPGGLIRTAATTPIDGTGLAAEPQFFAVHPDAIRLSELLADSAAGRIRVPIARRLPLASAAEAHQLVAAGGLGGKVILEP